MALTGPTGFGYCKSQSSIDNCYNRFSIRIAFGNKCSTKSKTI